MPPTPLTKLAGYLYIVLGGERFDTVSEMIQESYILRLAVAIAVASLLIGLAAGFLSIAYVLPKLGGMPLKDLHQIDIRDTLAPIWHAKPEAAKKALNRLRIIVRYGAAMGLDVDLQAVDKARALLGAQRRVRRNIAALDWREVPDFYQTLDDGTVTHLAFRLLILTACRSSEIRFCHLDEVHGDTWVIPPERMKAGRQHAVPLSNEAQAIIQEAKPYSRGGLLPVCGRGLGELVHVVDDLQQAALRVRIANLVEGVALAWMSEALEPGARPGLLGLRQEGG